MERILTPTTQSAPVIPTPESDRTAAFDWREMVQAAMGGAPLSIRNLDMMFDRMERQP